MGFLDFVEDAVNVGSFGLVGDGPLGSPLEQPRADPIAVQSAGQKRTEAALSGIFLDEELDEEGNVITPSLLSSAFQPGSRAALFKGTRQGIRSGAKKELTASGGAFDKQRELLLKNFEEKILPAIRERAGARGTGVSTGTQIGGVRAAEDAFLGLGVEQAQAEAGIVQRREANLQRSRELGSRAEDALLNAIIAGGLQQGGVAGVGQPLFGDSPLQQGAEVLSAVGEIIPG